MLEVRAMAHKNAALELLKKLLNDEIKTRARRNLVQGKNWICKAILVCYYI